jgi:hypothetical protein
VLNDGNEKKTLFTFGDLVSNSMAKREMKLIAVTSDHNFAVVRFQEGAPGAQPILVTDYKYYVFDLRTGGSSLISENKVEADVSI